MSISIGLEQPKKLLFTTPLSKLLTICCKAKIYRGEKCTCTNINVDVEINADIKINKDINKDKVITFDYNETVITGDCIDTFIISEKCKNDTNNNIRENIIGAIINDKVPDEYYEYSSRWKTIKIALDEYIDKLFKIKKFDLAIISKKCIHRGGRNYHYDFTIIINEEFNFNIEFKFNAKNISDAPQFVSPAKPSRFLENNYEEYFYDHYLPLIANFDGLEMPNKEDYLEKIHGPKPKCVSEYQTKYYKGSKGSKSKYTGKIEDIDFYQYCKKISKESIDTFIQNTDLKVDILTNYLQDTQRNKIYMLCKDDKFYQQEADVDNYQIIHYEKKPDISSYIATLKNGKKIKILLRWKNGNGIAYPAFQIS